MKFKRQGGAEIVEFALVLPILFALIFTVMQFGWLLFNHVVLTAAASSGARILASQRGYPAPYADTRTAVLSAASLLPNLQSALQIGMNVNGASCQSDALCTAALGSATSAPAPGTQASVSLDYRFTPMFGSWFGMMPATLRASMAESVQ